MLWVLQCWPSSGYVMNELSPCVSPYQCDTVMMTDGLERAGRISTAATLFEKIGYMNSRKNVSCLVPSLSNAYFENLRMISDIADV